MGFKCANCERDLNNLEQTQGEFYNWKKLPRTFRNTSNKRSKVQMNMHNIGHGFSKMLQTFSTDNLGSRDLLRSSLMEEENDEAEVMGNQTRDFFSDNEEELKKIQQRETPGKGRLLPKIKKAFYP
jgi:hypothetical protein